MFYIDIHSTAVKTAEEMHYKRMRCFVHKRIGRPGCGDTACPVCIKRLRRVHNLSPLIENFLSTGNNLERILRGKPADLFEVNREFWLSIFPHYSYLAWQPYFDKKYLYATYLGPHKPGAISVAPYVEQLSAIFDYEWFSDKKSPYNAYHLTNSLSRHTCTYCNRSYTHTIIAKATGEKIVRATLDHWYFKAGHPLLAVSFYNLIPSCHSCNSAAKGTALMDIATHTHPYIDKDQVREFAFNYTFKNTTSEYHIFVEPVPGAGTKAETTFRAMNLEEIYNTHVPELTDLLTIQQNYTGSYIQGLKKLLGGKLTTAEVYRIAFGTEYESIDFYKRPLSKFKHDILIKMGLLNNIED